MFNYSGFAYFNKWNHAHSAEDTELTYAQLDSKLPFSVGLTQISF